MSSPSHASRDTTGSPPRNSSHKHTLSALSTGSAPPQHLAEFYSFVNNKSTVSISPNESPASHGYPAPEFKGKRFNRQPSLNTFTSFTPSVLDLPNIVTMKDFNTTVDTYQNMLDKSERLQKALVEVSAAASEFGLALEDTINQCPKVNNPKLVADGMVNAGSLQYIVGSNNLILSRLLQSNFQRPLAEELKNLKQNYSDNYNFYQQEVKNKSRLLRQKELENIKLSKAKTRNLTVYKSNLVNLTNQLDEIDRLKYDYYHEVNSMIEKFNQDHLLLRTGSIVRAELELYESIARKGWSGGGLDQLLAVAPDIFAGDDEDLEQANDESHAPPETVSADVAEDSDVDETQDTVKLNNEYGDGKSTLKQAPPLTENNIHITPEHQILRDTSSPFLDRVDRLVEEEQKDESFSLPKIDNNSLVNKKHTESEKEETEVDYSKQNILDNLDS